MGRKKPSENKTSRKPPFQRAARGCELRGWLQALKAPHGKGVGGTPGYDMRLMPSVAAACAPSTSTSRVCQSYIHIPKKKPYQSLCQSVYDLGSMDYGGAYGGARVCGA
eukprot:scaffold7133_cov147-Isochrysis_galbana.AAC.2